MTLNMMSGRRPGPRSPGYSPVIAHFSDYETVVWRFGSVGPDDRYTEHELAQIEEIWSKRKQDVVQKGGNIFDAPIIALTSLVADKENLLITCGLTSYRHYVGTRNPEIDITRADPIGSIVIPISADGYIPIGRRSQSAEANPGKLFTFGGFFDPKEDLDQRGEPDIKACISREIEEELGCQIARRDICLLGLIYDDIFCHPEVVALASIDGRGDQIRAMGWQAELDLLDLVHASELDQFVGDRAADITPPFKSALYLASNELKRNAS